MHLIIIDTAFPHLRHDMTIAHAQMEHTGTMPPIASLAPDVVVDMMMCYAKYLVDDGRTIDAADFIDTLIYDDEAGDVPPLYSAWLWLAHMMLLMDGGNYTLALSSAENALHQLADITGKKSDDFLAILDALLYNLAIVHHNTGEDARAVKELTKSQQLCERLARKNQERFSPMLMHLVEASTAVIKSRSKQLSVLAYYQSETERYTRQLENSEGNDLREGMSHLVDALKNEGDIMLNMGNARNAVKYYTKALRYLKRMHDQLGERELRISIGLARALLRIINRRAAAEQLLNSLLPLARKLQASNEVIEIENLLSNKNRNVNIMTLLKSIF